MQGAVKQHLSQQPDAASQTPESKLGLTPAPPEEKAPTEDTGTFSPEGVYVPAGSVPAQGSPESKAAARSILGLPDQITQDQRNQIDATTPAERVLQAAKEGWRDAPTTPAARERTAVSLQALALASISLLSPSAIQSSALAMLSSKAARLSPMRALAPYSKPLARDVAALPEAFPTGDVGLPEGPRSYAEARAGSTTRSLYRSAPLGPPPVTLNELTGAIDRVPPKLHRPNQMMPRRAATNALAGTAARAGMKHPRRALHSQNLRQQVPKSRRRQSWA